MTAHEPGTLIGGRYELAGSPLLGGMVSCTRASTV